MCVLVREIDSCNLQTSKRAKKKKKKRAENSASVCATCFLYDTSA